MLVIALLFTLLIALCGLFLFSSGIWLGLLCILISGGMLVLHFLFLRKLKAPLRCGIETAGLVFCMFLLLGTDLRKQESHLLDFTVRRIEAEQLIAEGDKHAEDAIEDIEKDFGECDETRGLRATKCLRDGDLEGAADYIGQIRNHNRDYYSIKALYYISDVENDTTTKLRQLYLEAANEHPDWEYAQRMAGISQYDQQNYVSAQYYLAAAWELDPNQPMTWYYRGALEFRTGDYETALYYFQGALDNGADEELQSWILWYLEQM